jgi:hypothetical protein
VDEPDGFTFARLPARGGWLIGRRSPAGLALAIAALADGPTEIQGAEAVDVSYPGFFTMLGTLCE